MKETTDERQETTRQINMRVTPSLYGELAVIGALRGLTPVEQARLYIQNGLQRDSEIPEVSEVLNCADPARNALANSRQ